MTTSTDFVSIPIEEYLMLLDRQRKLVALENGGVDNWDWYDEAMEEYHNECSNE